jgi:hypothetical protein
VLKKPFPYENLAEVLIIEDMLAELGCESVTAAALAFRLVANFFAAVCIAAIASYATARYRS